MARLEGKVAYITGAASGIGREIALEFAREGARIVIADLNKQAADAAAAEIEKAGSKAIGVAVDVTDEAQVDAAVQAAAQAFGNINQSLCYSGVSGHAAFTNCADRFLSTVPSLLSSPITTPLQPASLQYWMSFNITWNSSSL